MRKFLLLLTLTACQASGPELIVVVHSDLGVPADFDVLLAAASENEPEIGDWSRVDLGSQMPLSLVVAPDGGGPITIDLEAQHQGTTLLRRRVRLDAPEEGTFLVPMFLARACTTTSCAGGQTCSERGCVDPSDIQYRPIERGTELDGLCVPGPNACDPSGLSINSCPVFGEPPIVTPCGIGNRCVGQGNCSPAGSGPWSVMVGKEGLGTGRVIANAIGIDCGNQCSATVADGNAVTFEAQPDSGSRLLDWTGCVGSGPTCSVSVRAPIQVHATFVLDTAPMLTVMLGGTGAGTVASADQRINCGNDCSEPYSANTLVELTATPAPGSELDGWTGPCASAGTVCNLTVNGSMSVVARFRRSAVTPGSALYDLDNDGYSDLIFAAPRRDALNQAEAGRVYVVFGPAPALVSGAEITSGRYEIPELGAHFGEAIALSPDLTGDGQPDLVIGAPGVFGGKGRVYVIPGGPNLVRGSGELPTNTLILAGEDPGSRFGASLTVGADLDKDGNPDLVVGAPGGLGRGGKVYVFFGGPTFIGRPASTASVIYTGETVGDLFGVAIAAIEDSNGDGADDLLIGAPDHDQEAGRAYLFFGGSNLQSRTADFADRIFNGSVGSRFGANVAGVGDFLFDVHGDLAIGAPNVGTVFVFSGAAPWFMLDATAADRSFTGSGLFGAALSGGDDYDGDGVGDLVIGAPENGGPSAGRVAIYRGHTTTTDPDFTIGGNCLSTQTCQSEGFGVAVGPAGDQDGDGILDLAVGSRFGGGIAGPPNRGRITVHHFAPGASSDQWSEDAYLRVLGENQANGLCSVVLSN